MAGPVSRNAIVRFFGQPQRCDGSVNEPRTAVENGLRFNERWTYRHLRSDPAGAVERRIYWHRYDYVGSTVRASEEAPWERDDSLPDALR
jgi:hypothetical protein